MKFLTKKNKIPRRRLSHRMHCALKSFGRATRCRLIFCSHLHMAATRTHYIFIASAGNHKNERITICVIKWIEGDARRLTRLYHSALRKYKHLAIVLYCVGRVGVFMECVFLQRKNFANDWRRSHSPATCSACFSMFFQSCDAKYAAADAVYDIQFRFEQHIAMDVLCVYVKWIMSNERNNKMKYYNLLRLRQPLIAYSAYMLSWIWLRWNEKCHFASQTIIDTSDSFTLCDNSSKIKPKQQQFPILLSFPKNNGMDKRASEGERRGGRGDWRKWMAWNKCNCVYVLC